MLQSGVLVQYIGGPMLPPAAQIQGIDKRTMVVLR
jgi:hypothetical protein